MHAYDFSSDLFGRHGARPITLAPFWPIPCGNLRGLSMPSSRYHKDRIGNHMLHPETLLARTLHPFGVLSEGFADGIDATVVRAAATAAVAKGRVSVILVESPSNPMNSLVDLAQLRTIADKIAVNQSGLRPVIVC